MTAVWVDSRSKAVAAAVALLVVLVAAVGCSSRPGGVLSKGDMAELLADIHQAEGVVETERNLYSSDSSRRVLREAIYRRHGVTAEQVDSSMMWYGRHIEDYMEVYDNVIEILQDRLEIANAVSARTAGSGDNNRPQVSVVSMEGDSVDVWTGPRFRRFYDISGSDYITYRVNRDFNWETGDVYTLNIKAINPHSPITVVMIAEYRSGEPSVAHSTISTNGWADLRLPLDRDREAQSLAVSISYDPAPSEVFYVDSISLVRKRFGRSRPVIPTDTAEHRQLAPVVDSMPSR